jgi:hypothetical protein
MGSKNFIRRRSTEPVVETPEVQVVVTPQPEQIIQTNTSMFKNFKPTWEWAFLLMLWITCLAVLIVGTIAIFAKKYTHGYSLGTKSSGVLTITKEMDWTTDDEIVLDRNVSYSEAVRIVDSLNKTIR